MRESKSAEELRDVFKDETSAGFLTECGLSQPLQYKAKQVLLTTLTDFHLMLRVKAVMDQFIEGLEDQRLLGAIRNNPSAFKAFFTFSTVPISGGKYI